MQTNYSQVPKCREAHSEVDQAAECTDEISVEEVQECIRGLKNKKGSKNYWGISSLLSVPGKVYAIVLEDTSPH